MVTSMKAIGSIIVDKAKDYMFGLMETVTKVSGVMIKWMEKAHSLIRMEIKSKQPLKMTV